MVKYLALGLNGLAYAVFDNTYDAWEYAYQFDLKVACFGGFENAVILGETLGLDGV